MLLRCQRGKQGLISSCRISHSLANVLIWLPSMKGSVKVRRGADRGVAAVAGIVISSFPALRRPQYTI